MDRQVAGSSVRLRQLFACPFFSPADAAPTLADRSTPSGKKGTSPRARCSRTRTTAAWPTYSDLPPATSAAEHGTWPPRCSPSSPWGS
jgi:hypothetical protein